MLMMVLVTVTMQEVEWIPGVAMTVIMMFMMTTGCITVLEGTRNYGIVV